MGEGQTRFYYWAMAPAVVLVGVFFVVPLLQVLWLSVSEPALGLQNYAALIENPLLQRVWLNTLRVCALTTLIAVTAGYLVAYVMAHVHEHHRALMISCIVLTFWLSVPRYLLALVPSALLLSPLLARRPPWRWTVLAISGGLMAFGCSIFASGRFLA